jgi:hypothetical protein
MATCTPRTRKARMDGWSWVCTAWCCGVARSMQLRCTYHWPAQRERLQRALPTPTASASSPGQSLQCLSRLAQGKHQAPLRPPPAVRQASACCRRRRAASPALRVRQARLSRKQVEALIPFYPPALAHPPPPPARAHTSCAKAFRTPCNPPTRWVMLAHAVASRSVGREAVSCVCHTQPAVRRRNKGSHTWGGALAEDCARSYGHTNYMGRWGGGPRRRSLWTDRRQSGASTARPSTTT